MSGEPAPTARRFSLRRLGPRLAVCRLEPDARIPAWLDRAPFWFAARTGDELSLVVPEATASPRWRQETGFRAFRVEGQLDFALVGVMAELAGAVAEVEVSIFALSTFDTDYLLVREGDCEAAASAWRRHGHEVWMED